MLDGAYDVAEMSFATFLKAREQGRDLIGIPIFTGRGFLQRGLIVGASRGIVRPEDLAGRRVGVPQFWMTSSVWHRGILSQQYGIAAAAVTWLTAVEERFDGVTFSDRVTVERLEPGVSLEAALERGLVDAVAIPPRGVPRPLRPFMRWPYPDVGAVEDAYAAATGIFPIMHFVVLRASLDRERPALAGALVAAFGEAKRRAAATGALANPDRWPMGLAENARTLEAFLGFARDQGWVSRSLALADCFTGG